MEKSIKLLKEEAFYQVPCILRVIRMFCKEKYITKLLYGFFQVFPNTILQTYSVKHHSRKYQNAEHYAIKQLLFF